MNQKLKSVKEVDKILFFNFRAHFPCRHPLLHENAHHLGRLPLEIISGGNALKKFQFGVGEGGKEGLSWHVPTEELSTLAFMTDVPSNIAVIM